MRIGIPREIKPREGRVGLIPAACADLIQAGHQLVIEQDAGLASGYEDAAYRKAGVEIVEDAVALYGAVDMIVKVKEPIGPELELLQPRHLLFCYLHLAASAELTRRLCDTGATAVAFETVTGAGGLPLLAPMSDIAGRIATQAGCQLLYRTSGGSGLLLGGVPGVDPGHVVVLGAGQAGSSAVRVAAALGARVTVFDLQRERLVAMRELGANVVALAPFGDVVAEQVAAADLVIGAVLVAGARAPRLVTRQLVASMRPGSVVVDIAIDQGGCIETAVATTWDDPVVEVEGVLHMGVTNMPGAVPRSASQALSAVIAPYVRRLAAGDWERDEDLRNGINVRAGQVEHPAVRESMTA